MAALVWAAVHACAAGAENLRIATFNAELSRTGPGLLLRDIERRDDQVMAAARVIAATNPDILALQGFDWDHDGVALAAFAGLLAEEGADYPHRFAERPNSGLATDMDLDGDGRRGGAGDAQGYGEFAGQGGMAVLSRFPIASDGIRDFTALLWRDLPGAILPENAEGGPFPSAGALDVQRLSTNAHWVVPIDTPGAGRVHLMTFHASPPVFDGPEDRNGRRNHDEIAFWRLYLDGAFGPAPKARFVIAGDANLDSQDSDGRREAIRALLSDPQLTDPQPRRTGAAGPGAGDTVDWPAPGPGRLRVDYVLPSTDWEVVGSGIFWPAVGEPGHDDAITASRHRLVWVDLAP
ncbi:endonuclease/exonuclease/phosphatase family protein [Pukyongiella litopenaei]|uniref:Endonuclease/exonuclease/phosphatase family protein n=1 Tax=Pukyongiella litopenaei TaxID=2605946 RepID=A0A2S0MV01_9RHOB|nr:endonuclease/exonuclease/phosphatase family protein [Pukyongiella litopenaei]